MKSVTLHFLKNLSGCGAVGRPLVLGTSLRRFESYHPDMCGQLRRWFSGGL